jgi:hypothetical protein
MVVEEVHHGLMVVVAVEYMGRGQQLVDHLSMLLQIIQLVYLLLAMVAKVFQLGLAGVRHVLTVLDSTKVQQQGILKLAFQSMVVRVVRWVRLMPGKHLLAVRQAYLVQQVAGAVVA